MTSHSEPTAGNGPAEYFSQSFAQFDNPGKFSGQIQTDAGTGSGFVPLDRVVATCAHALLDDVALSYVPGVRWYFQHYADQYETPPQFPRKPAPASSPAPSVMAPPHAPSAASFFNPTKRAQAR